jgi:hypothetical protein
MVGGGSVPLEAPRVLRRTAVEAVRTTFLAPERDLTYRPRSVPASFAAADGRSFRLARIAADASDEPMEALSVIPCRGRHRHLQRLDDDAGRSRRLPVTVHLPSAEGDAAQALAAPR